MNEQGMNRRDAITALGGIGFAGALAACASAQPAKNASRSGMSLAALGWDEKSKQFTVPPLPYEYNALEPYIDEQTMRIHHDKHHAGYVRGLNKALSKLAAIRAGDEDASLIKHWSREASFHGSGHVNHALFWFGMAPPSEGGGGKPSGALAGAINSSFGSFEGFSKQFQAASGAVEGSGWGWLVYEPISGDLMILQGEKQQDLMLTGVTPLLGVDVWEHAYYLKYQNRRGDYVQAFMNVINWPEINRRYERAVNA